MEMSNTYVFNNAPGIPPVPVNDLTQAAGLVVEPSIVALERGPQHRDALRRPDGTQDAPSRRGAVLGRRIMVLQTPVSMRLHEQRWMLTHNVTLRNVGKSLRDILGDEEGMGKLVEARFGGGLIGRRADGPARRRCSEAGSVGMVRGARMMFVSNFGVRIMRDSVGFLHSRCLVRRVDDSLARIAVAALEAIAVSVEVIVQGQAVVRQFYRLVRFVGFLLLLVMDMVIVMLLVLAEIVCSSRLVLGGRFCRCRCCRCWKRQQTERRGRGGGHKGSENNDGAHFGVLLTPSYIKLPFQWMKRVS